MNTCLITGRDCGDADYSPEGLALLHPELTHLEPFPMATEEELAAAMKSGWPIVLGGIQPKIPANLDASEGRMVPARGKSRYLIKLHWSKMPQAPQNEALTMQLAKACGVHTPPTGLMRAAGGRLVYVIKRFDYTDQGSVHCEQFDQIVTTKKQMYFAASCSFHYPHKIALDMCSNPAREKREYCRRFLARFLVGSEDRANLANWMLTTNAHGEVRISPDYDYVNLVLYNDPNDAGGELLNHPDNRTRMRAAVARHARLGTEVPEDDFRKILGSIRDALPRMRNLIRKSHLSKNVKVQYRIIFENRASVLFG